MLSELHPRPMPSTAADAAAADAATAAAAAADAADPSAFGVTCIIGGRR